MRFTAKQFGAVIIPVALSFTVFLPIVYFQRQVLAQGVSDRRREEADKWMELGEKQLESKIYNATRESIDSSKINREFTVTIDSSKINISYINLEELTYLSIALWKLGKVEEAENILNKIMKFAPLILRVVILILCLMLWLAINNLLHQVTKAKKKFSMASKQTLIYRVHGVKILSEQL